MKAELNAELSVSLPLPVESTICKSRPAIGTAVLAATIQSAGTYIVVASAIEPGKTVGNFQLCVSSAVDVELVPKVLAPTVIKQRYAYAWKGAGAGGAIQEDDGLSWRYI